MGVKAADPPMWTLVSLYKLTISEIILGYEPSYVSEFSAIFKVEEDPNSGN
jgi:hypothetical protein